MKYISGGYDKLIDGIQYIRIGDGCPNQCEPCYCPKEIQYYGIPPARSRYVKVLDMNLLCYPNVLAILKLFRNRKFEGQKIHYELVCGIDYRFLTKEIAVLLKKSGIIKPRFAWDGSSILQYKMKDCWIQLKQAGFKNISSFILCNWKVPYNECLFKLDLLKIWNVKVCDCYYDGQISPNITPIHWSEKEIKNFRRKCRKHNQMVLFKIDPELKVSNSNKPLKRLVTLDTLIVDE